jgi:hypothetical protein
VGGFANDEIPLLVMLFYLFRDVEPSLHGLVLELEAGPRWSVIYAEDIVRWGVWLGRHIC